MESRHVRSKAAAIIVFFLLFLPSISHASGVSVWAVRDARGGGSEALDAIPSLDIGGYDFALLLSADSEFSVWKASNDNASEGWPLRVRPDDGAGGVTCFHRASMGVSNFQVYGGVTVVEGVRADYVAAGNSIYFLYSGVTLTAEMLAGGIIYNFSTTGIDVGLPPLSGSTACFLIKDMTGSGLTVHSTGTELMMDYSDIGTRSAVSPEASRSWAAFQSVVESGTCKFWDVLSTGGGTWTIDD